MHILRLWMIIWHGSISGNICLIEVSNPAKFDAFIKKRTILFLNSWTSLRSEINNINKITLEVRKSAVVGFIKQQKTFSVVA